ncbi:MAG TPA: glycosyltransferase family 4 protein [Burkholderiales bacterium]|nr:glycosyltransferase family 4 protein [Burkholderiales bacterium]
MQTRLYSHIAMLGVAPETRSGIATVVDAYRSHGLFQRWPLSYLATDNVAKAAHAFGSLLAQHRRILVHAHIGAGHWMEFGRSAAFMGAAMAARCPLIVHLHGTRLNPSLGWFLKRADVVMVPCEAMRSWVRSVARMSDVVVAPPPVAIEVPAVSSKPNLVLFLGRLEAEKGIYDLLEAVAAVRANVPDLRLVCAGEGDRIGVARYAERLGIADAVKFTGWVGPSGKRALLEHAAVFALPSYKEALPASLIEAMGAGIPVIASPVGGIPEVVVDGATGFLVGAGDTKSLRRALDRLLADRALARRMGEAARQAVFSKFDAHRAIGVVEDLYEALGVSIIAERAPRIQPVPLKKAA